MNEMNEMKTSNHKPRRSFLPKDRRSQIMLGVLVLLGLILGVIGFAASSRFVARMRILNLPGEPVLQDQQPLMATDAVTGELLPTATSPAPAAVEVPQWDGKSRVNLLVMGLDARDLEEKAPRTDTMILLTFDPIRNTAGMISIPRDLWVNIPGSGYGTVNTAYSIGEMYQLPGGGPAKAMQTVEALLGAPIQYYAQIDFEAFKKFIDHIDGVKVTVTETVLLDYLGEDNSWDLEPGVVTLTGRDALAYVRSRSTPGVDFDRAARQQQVIIGIKDRIVDFKMLPRLIQNANAIYEDLSTGIRTNLDLNQVIALASKAINVPSESITRYVIDQSMVNFSHVDGKDVLRPYPDKIRELRDRVFSGIGVAQDTQTTLQEEQARVSIKNGSSSAGFEARTADFLRQNGINVVDSGPGTYTPATKITIYGARPYALRYLVDTFKITHTPNIIYAFDPNATIDLLLEFGDDWVNSGTLP